MVPMRHSTIFKSRWMALLWAAGIIWFAYDFAGSGQQQASAGNNVSADSSGTQVSADDQNKIAQILGG